MDSLSINLIREVFHYHSRFQGGTMVFYVDFPVADHAAFPLLMNDLALLAQSGIKTVLVPGAREWIDAMLAEHGLKTELRFGQRVTTAEAMPFVEMAAFHVGTRYVTTLGGCHADAVMGNFVRARGRGVVEGVDMERTGLVDKILTRPLLKLLDLGMIPVLPCVGCAASGKTYNVSSAEIALAACRTLGASKFFIVKAGPPVESANSWLTPPEAHALINQINDPEKTRYLRLAAAACEGGVERAHIVNGLVEGAVLAELFSNKGAGVMVHADEYASIRPLKYSDIPEVLRIMEPLVRQGNLIRRSLEDIASAKDDYVVFEIDGAARACGALFDWGEGQGEIGALAVDQTAATGMGCGERIVHCLLERAKKAGLSRVFVLTTRAADWFETQGFREVAVDTLPSRKRAVYDWKRRSKVYAMDLHGGA
jgi:amino-acid N-acetyltransferase